MIKSSLEAFGNPGLEGRGFWSLARREKPGGGGAERMGGWGVKGKEGGERVEEDDRNKGWRLGWGS